MAPVVTSIATQAAAAAPAPVQTAAAAGRLAQVVAAARQGMAAGTPYRWGGGHGGTPSLAGGVDCSGFVRWAYYVGFGGLDIGGGSSESVRTGGNFVRTENPVPGDLVYFGRGGRAPAYHTGVYLGVINGQPAIAAAVTTGTNAHIQYYSSSNWASDFMGFYRLRAATPTDVQGIQPTTTSIRLSHTTASMAQRFTASGSVKLANGSPAANVPVKLYQKTPNGAWRLGATVNSDARGNVSYSLRASTTGNDFKLVAAGTSTTSTSTSQSVRQSVSLPITVTRRPGIVANLGAVGAIYGTTSPTMAGKLVRVQRITKAGWVSAGGATMVGADGRFSIHFRMNTPGGNFYRLYSPGSGHIAPSASAVWSTILR